MELLVPKAAMRLLNQEMLPKQGCEQALMALMVLMLVLRSGSVVVPGSKNPALVSR